MLFRSGAAIGVPATLLVGAAVHVSASVAVALVPDVRRLRRREALTREIVIRR